MTLVAVWPRITTATSKRGERGDDITVAYVSLFGFETKFGCFEPQ